MELCCFFLHPRRGKCLRTWTVTDIWGGLSPLPNANSRNVLQRRMKSTPPPGKNRAMEGNWFLWNRRVGLFLSLNLINSMPERLGNNRSGGGGRNRYKWRLPLQGASRPWRQSQSTPGLGLMAQPLNKNESMAPKRGRVEQRPSKRPELRIPGGEDSGVMIHLRQLLTTSPIKPS